MPVPLSRFARSLTNESAFSVLAIAKALKARGKDVVELEIGDSPFETPAAAKASGISAIQANQTHYCPSPGLPEFRQAAAAFVKQEFGIPVGPENIAVGPGAKIFEQFFCEAFLEPDDSVLVFSPQFPTYAPNIHRRGARMVTSDLKQSHQFRPEIAAIEKFLTTEKQPKAIFLNSPHNPTGGVTTEQDLRDIADLIRGKNIAVFSDEPYCHMVWEGQHHSLLAQPGMIDQCLAAYTFSKSYSMSGWRLGFAVASAEVTEAIGKMINTSVSCTPPLVQMAGLNALTRERTERDRQMGLFHEKVQLLTAGLSQIEGFQTLPPAATFYVFPNVMAICQRLKITSHGLAMYLLEGADDQFGVACLGGECFGAAGAGFLRFSCAEPNERLQQAIDFISVALGRRDRIDAYLATHPHYRL
ncbi:MAG: aminotransferase class I/II-fold pyridoxal phosphate-dependent enzyme [Planctomycetota bacterium]|nr:MAG: aminotransferase class I/II-fold pyridoxal phosphate-dependent enzyme [Planctomycetota bacterium]